MRNQLTDAQRQDFARRARTESVAKIAAEAGVQPQTVRNWMTKFPASTDNATHGSLAGVSLTGHASVRGAASDEPPNGVRRRTPMSDAERRTLRSLPEELDLNPPWWAYAGSFAPQSFSDRLGRIAEAHRSAEHPQGAVNGMVSAVKAIKRLLDGHSAGDTPDYVHAHGKQLHAVVDACVVKAETRGPDGALRLLNDALSGWGRSGIEADRLTQRGAIPEWERRRIKAEAAVGRLGPMLARHPEYCGDREVPCRRDGNHVVASPRYYKHGSIFHTPSELMEDDWDWPKLVGGAELEEMAKRAATAEGLEVGTEVEIVIFDQEKGWVDVGYTIKDPAATAD